MQRRHFLKGALMCAAITSIASSAWSQRFAGRQIRLIVPFPAGGPTDIVARPLSQLLGEALKTTMVVDNRGGAGGSIGADAVAKASPDGTTLLVGTVGTHAINASLYRKLAYDPIRDFTPISMIAAAPVAVVVHASLPVKTLADLVELAKKSPGKLTYGSAGNGTPGHLTGEMFKAVAQVSIQHIPYRGSAPAVTDLVGGQIDIMFDPLQSVLSNAQGEKLRALAITSVARSSVLPNVPTISESGYKDFESTAWWALFGPANLPVDLATLLAEETIKIVHSSTFREKLEPLGVVPTAMSRGDFVDFQRRELAKWGKAVRDSGATMD